MDDILAIIFLSSSQSVEGLLSVLELRLGNLLKKRLSKRRPERRRPESRRPESRRPRASAAAKELENGAEAARLRAATSHVFIAPLYVEWPREFSPTLFHNTELRKEQPLKRLKPSVELLQIHGKTNPKSAFCCKMQ